jgi:hypothetical protein
MLTFSYEAITGGPNSDKDGVPGNQEDRRVQHVIPQAAVDAGRYEVIIEVSCNGMFGLGMNGYRHQRPDVSIADKTREKHADERLLAQPLLQSGIRRYRSYQL